MFRTLFLLLISMVFAGAIYWQVKPTDIKTVSIITAERGDISNVINLTGKVINDKTVTLSALVNGQITEMKIAKGQIVKQGQILARFDRREADAELLRLQAEEDLATQKSKLARNTLDRLLNMGSAGSVSQQQIDDTQTEWRISKAQLKVSKSAYTIAQIQREKYDVTAPFSGVITEKTTEVGQWVEAGTSLFTLVALDGREIEVNIDSSDRGLIKIDLPANLTSDAWPERTWIEKIHWLAPAVSKKDNEALNSFTARLTLSKEAPPLILGQQIDVELVLEYKPEVLKVPYSVLIENKDSKQIAIVDESNQIELRDISIGIEDITHFEITTKLENDERIAITQEIPFTQGQLVIVE